MLLQKFKYTVHSDTSFQNATLDSYEEKKPQQAKETVAYSIFS